MSHHAANSRTLIEYSVHVHSHCVSRDCQMAVTMETSCDVYSTRVDPAYTLAKQSLAGLARATVGELVLVVCLSWSRRGACWCAGFYCIVLKCGNLSCRRTQDSSKARTDTPRVGDKGKALTRHWILLSLLLVWIHPTGQSPERWNKKNHQKTFTKFMWLIPFDYYE